MPENLAESVQKFVAPIYADKDELHGMGHIRRLLASAQALAADAPVCDQTVLTLGAFLHGCDAAQEEDIRVQLISQGFAPGYVDRGLLAARDSRKENKPVTVEGAYLHDAHLLEGTDAFAVTKCLYTGALRGQSLEETLDIIESTLLGRFSCVLPQNQPIYAQRERFMSGFVQSVRASL